jgi:hypothetical protein
MIYFAGMNYLDMADMCGISITSSRAPEMLKMSNYCTYVVRTRWSRSLPIIGERAAKALSKRPSITGRLSRRDEQLARQTACPSRPQSITSFSIPSASLSPESLICRPLEIEKHTSVVTRSVETMEIIKGPTGDLR